MENNKQVATRHDAPVMEYMPPLSAAGVREQVNLIQEVMRGVMEGPSKDNPTGTHYGIIPGCGKKPSLYKAGAEKLSLVFRLRPIMADAADIDVMDMGNGHREYRVRCHILDQRGNEVATGVGSCSTLESKYRYRKGSDFEVQDCEIPQDYREQKAKYRNEGFGAKQVDGVWKWVKYSSEGRSENPDIADTYNTVLKMAKKRAYVDGILSSTAASDIFSQDLEDLPASALGGGMEATAAPSKPADSKPDSKAHQEPRRASSGHTEATGEAKSITAKVVKRYKPRGNSKYSSWIMEGHDGEYLQSMDEAIVDQMNEAGAAAIPVTVRYTETVNGQYTNRVITSVEPVAAAQGEGDAQEPEEAQVGD